MPFRQKFRLLRPHVIYEGFDRRFGAGTLKASALLVKADLDP